MDQLHALSEWLKHASGFTINPDLLSENEMNLEIVEFGKIVDDVVRSLSRELSGLFWERGRYEAVLLKKLYGVFTTW